MQVLKNAFKGLKPVTATSKFTELKDKAGCWGLSEARGQSAIANDYVMANNTCSAIIATALLSCQKETQQTFFVIAQLPIVKT